MNSDSQTCAPSKTQHNSILASQPGLLSVEGSLNCVAVGRRSAVIVRRQARLLIVCDVSFGSGERWAGFARSQMLTAERRRRKNRWKQPAAQPLRVKIDRHSGLKDPSRWCPLDDCCQGGVRTRLGPRPRTSPVCRTQRCREELPLRTSLRRTVCFGMLGWIEVGGTSAVHSTSVHVFSWALFSIPGIHCDSPLSPCAVSGANV